jgi:hypothetical protein
MPSVFISYSQMQLLETPNRLSEARLLIQQALTIIMKFTCATCHKHPYLRTVKPLEVQAQLTEAAQATGFNTAEWATLQTSLQGVQLQ